MGHVSHNAIVVTSWSTETAVKARVKAANLGLPVTSLVESTINGYASFMIAPDGSKSGWKNDEEGETARDQWIAWTKTVRYDDESSNLEWVEVRFGSDDWGTNLAPAEVVNHEWKDRVKR